MVPVASLMIPVVPLVVPVVSLVLPVVPPVVPVESHFVAVVFFLIPVVPLLVRGIIQRNRLVSDVAGCEDDRELFELYCRSSNAAAKASVKPLHLPKVLAAISSLSRWEILRELIKDQPLPVCEIAIRLRASETSISKHVAVLLSSGVVCRHYGLYMIEPRFLVPGESSLDFGCILIRFNPPA